MAKRNNDPTLVVTGKDTRWSYANVWQPKSINGGKEKYSVSLIIPKSDTKTVESVKKAIKAAYEAGEFKLRDSKGNIPPLDRIHNPLRDGDTDKPDDAAYKDSYFINAKSDNAPGIVDINKQDIIDTSEVYSGVYGRAAINFYAYNTNGSKGIACGLQHLQKIKDGPILGNRTKAEDVFDDLDDDDDFLN